MFYLFGEDKHKEIEDDLIKKHRQLFEKYFNSNIELEDFINKNLGDSKDNIQRRTINTVERLVALADELIVVKPGKWDLAIFFLLSCIESIYTLNEYELKKQEIIIDFFENYISDKERRFLIKNIKISDERAPYNYEINNERFSLLLISIRNQVAHEGVYWNLHFIEEEADERIPKLNRFFAKPDKNSQAKEVVFLNTMKFSELRDIFIKGFIRFINKHNLINSVG
ncbi:hypothetical protein [Paenibacillus sp. QZ-Y1]|uniref:hypothetical protein n=1 Tax=Paenibacillus sp. QZ-Y1 TaxID=3414511 RepID=UPI003F78DF46